MKQGNVRCNDCHLGTSGIFKPDSKICVKCHDADYANTLSEWKKDVYARLKEAENLLNEVKNKNLSEEDKAVVNDTRKLISTINSNPSLYVHNNDLLSTLLSGKIKLLTKMK